MNVQRTNGIGFEGMKPKVVESLKEAVSAYDAVTHGFAKNTQKGVVEVYNSGGIQVASLKPTHPEELKEIALA